MTVSNSGSAVPHRRADARRNRERVLAVAREAFGERGADASLDDIARRAKVGPGTLYRHFPTRQALLEAVCRDWVEALHAEARDLLAARSPIAALATWLRAFVGHVTVYRGLAAALLIGMHDDESALHAMCEAMEMSGATLLTRAQQAGEVRTDADITDVLTLANAIALATEGTPAGDTQADRLLALVLDGLIPPGVGKEVIALPAPTPRQDG